MALRLDRRTFLRGAAGVAVALPALEIMGVTRWLGGSRAAAGVAAPPKRFFVAFGGVSTGADGESPDQLLVPDTIGPGWDVKRALQPIADFGVRDDVTVITGLTVPWGSGADIPPGGRSIYYHYNTVGPQMSGMRGPDERDGAPQGPTCDQIVADAIGAETRFRSLAYRVQPCGYVGRNEVISGNSGRLSWRRDESGELRGVDPIVSPRLAYESLFTGFTPTDPAEAERARMLLRQRRSALDFVRESTTTLLPQLGREDRVRMEQHFEHIRSLERRLDEIAPPMGACLLPDHPGEDPALGGAIIEYEGAGSPYSTSEGWSGEERRAEVLTDLVHMAFTCDLTRSVSMLITEWKCYLNMFQVAGWEADMHTLTHDGNQEGVADAIAFHVRPFARLVQKLRDTREVDGSSVLDHTALVLAFEGGQGYDPEGDRGGSSHSTENMSMLLAGRAGGLRAGQHLRTSGTHPSSVIATAMAAVGGPSTLGEIAADVPGLL